VDEDGHDVVVELRPPVPEAEVATLRAGYPVPLPAELVQLLAVTRGAEALLDLDLTGRDHSVELAELMPAGLPIAADGFGNFWVLDLTPDTAEVAPVFFHCHDAPVLLYPGARPRHLPRRGGEEVRPAARLAGRRRARGPAVRRVAHPAGRHGAGRGAVVT
jgi:hypothetical protein